MTFLCATTDSSLEQFTLLAKNARGRACEALIHQVLSNPDVFLFSQLLVMPNIAALENTEFQSSYRLLQIFAFGTYNDYNRERQQLPELNPASELKLRKLSVVSLAQHRKDLSYEVLMGALDVHTIRALEDVLIDAIYSGLVQGKLDQKTRSIRVTYVVARDVQSHDIVSMKDKLKEWQLKAFAVCDKIDSILSHATKTVGDNVAREERIQSKIKATMERSKGNGNRMHVDDATGESSPGSRKSSSMKQRSQGPMARKRV
uniref:PREDICTED: similar to cop9 complex subunit 7a putat n=1 Tax=Albugo laibachii Nc14 TaxID=890382 RepID=F0W385_9STRA|nr:PREDICTED: similar to cop9 complex subunit 7a putat [Albugo laibachii Nc14]|eukprot:CCA15526.1 PREDICTED: similar to cop9 complex subunit 7a putat [Albugo laibachii Nc14]